MMTKSTANPVMEKSMAQKAMVTARALARSTWIAARGWASSQRGERKLAIVLKVGRSIAIAWVPEAWGSVYIFSLT